MAKTGDQFEESGTTWGIVETLMAGQRERIQFVSEERSYTIPREWWGDLEDAETEADLRALLRRTMGVWNNRRQGLPPDP